MEKEKNYSRRTEKDYGFLRIFLNKIFYFLFVRTAAKYMYNLKVEGKENVPKGSHFIVAPNHVSYCDPEFVTYAIGKLVAYMAKRELFHMDAKMPIKSIKGRKVLRFLAWELGAFEVDRDKPKPSTFKTVRSVFNTSWAFGIFPEGGVRQDKKIRDLKRGVAYFARKYKADVLPVAVCGFTWYATRLFQRNMTIKIGKPISHTLEEKDILIEWARQISDMTGFENLVEEQLSAKNPDIAIK